MWLRKLLMALGLVKQIDGWIVGNRYLEGREQYETEFEEIGGRGRKFFRVFNEYGPGNFRAPKPRPGAYVKLIIRFDGAVLDVKPA